MASSKFQGHVHDFAVKAGHAIFRRSVSLKEFGEQKQLSALVSIGKFCRGISMRFPAK